MNACAVPLMFERRGNGLALATVDDVNYWLTSNPDTDGAWRFRVTAQWTDADGLERRAQVGAEWIGLDPSPDGAAASALVREHHDRIVRGDVVGRIV